MNYRLSLFTLTLFCSTLSSMVLAQEDNYFNKLDKNGQDRVFYTGLVAGMNAAQIDGDNFSGYHKVGLNAGLISFVKFSPKLFASIEMLYAQKGARDVKYYESQQVGTVPIIYQAQLDYIEIPLMLHLETYEKFYIGTGLSYSRLIKEKESIDAVLPNTINGRIPNFAKDDLQFLLSASYQLYGNIFVRARYQYSLKTIRAASNIPLDFNRSAQYNNLFALQLILFL